MRKHPALLEEAGIDAMRYNELQWICRQYPGYVRKIRRVRAGIVDRPPGRAGRWKRPDPTGNAAVNIAGEVAWMEARVKMIDACARKVAPAAVAKAIVKSVTERGASYETLRPPCGRRQFFDLRLWFYRYLDEALKGL